MPRLHARGASDKPVHVLGIADPASIPQARRAVRCTTLRAVDRFFLAPLACVFPPAQLPALT